MPGLLGALVAGGAVGYGQADDKNVATQNQQAMAENLNEDRAAVDDMYAQATEQRHIQQGRAGAAYQGATISARAAEILASQGKTMPDPNNPTPGAADDASIASVPEQRDAMNLAAQQLGMLDTKTAAETSSKESVVLAQADAKLEAANIIGQYNVLAQSGRGKDAEQIRASAELLRAAGTGYSSQVNAYEKILGNPMLDEAVKAPARAAYQQLLMSGPPATPGALNSGSTPPASTQTPVPLGDYVNSLGK